MKKVYLLVVVTIIVIAAISMFACTSSKKNEEVTPRTDFDIFIYNTSLDSQSSYEISVNDATKYTVKMSDVENKREGLLSAFDTISDDFYDYNGTYYTKMGSVTLSPEEKANGYQFVVFTSVAKDQDDTSVGKIIRINNVTLKQTNKKVETLSLEAGCTIFVAKMKL